MTFSIPTLTDVLPEHLSVRPTRLDDADGVAQLINDYNMALVGQQDADPNELRTDWQGPNFNLETDSIVVTTREGQIVGTITVWNAMPPYVRVWAWGCTHPDYHGQGIGTYLVRWAEERARQDIDKAPSDALVTIGTDFYHFQEEPKSLLINEGYALTRHFWQMKIDLTAQPPAPEFGPNITIRTLADGVPLRELVAAFDESFEDHWGHVPVPLENLLERWEHWLAHDPDQDPTMWYAAMDGDQIAAVCLCSAKTTEDPEMGYVNILGVRRGWRKQGLGLALLHLAFGEFYQRGKASVGLGVDASSLTGATRLYERAGMRVNKQWDFYRKTLRDGIDLSTQSVE